MTAISPMVLLLLLVAGIVAVWTILRVLHMSRQEQPPVQGEPDAVTTERNGGASTHEDLR